MQGCAGFVIGNAQAFNIGLCVFSSRLVGTD